MSTKDKKKDVNEKEKVPDWMDQGFDAEFKSAHKVDIKELESNSENGNEELPSDENTPLVNHVAKKSNEDFKDTKTITDESIKSSVISAFIPKEDDVSTISGFGSKRLKEKDSSSGRERTIRPTFCHSFFILITYYSILSLAFLLISQLAPLISIKLRGLHLYLRIYIAFFSVVLLLVELEFPFFSGSSGFMENWLSRGILHSFLGLVNQEESAVIYNKQESYILSHEANGLSELSALLDLFLQVTSWMMVVSGILYTLMGALCLKKVKDSCVSKYKEELDKERRRVEKMNNDNMSV